MIYFMILFFLEIRVVVTRILINFEFAVETFDIKFICLQQAILLRMILILRVFLGEIPWNFLFVPFSLSLSRSTIYHHNETRVNQNMDNQFWKYYRKWLQLPVCANIMHLSLSNKKLQESLWEINSFALWIYACMRLE